MSFVPLHGTDEFSMSLRWGSTGSSSLSNFQTEALLEALLLFISSKIEGEKRREGINTQNK